MLLIDAYNVLWLGEAADPRGPDLSVSGLLRLIAHSRYRRRAVRLVCDGHPAPGEGVSSPAFGVGTTILRLGPGEIVYSGHDGSADDVIERIIDSHSSPRDLLVVSSDRRVKRAAGRKRARTMASELFLAHVLSDRTRAPVPALPAFVQEIPLGTHAIDLWRREFGLAPESDRSLIDALSPAPFNGNMTPLGAPPLAPVATPPPQSPKGPGKERMHPPPAPTVARPGDDPLLKELLQEWGLVIDLDDLDTGRWLDDRPRPHEE